MFGIDFLDKLVDDIGLPLVKKGIKSVTGIDLDEKVLTNEDKQKIMNSQIEIMNIDFKKLELEFNKTKETNRHEEKHIEVEIGDKQNARASDHLAPLQTDIAKEVYSQTKWQIPLLLISNIILVLVAKQLQLDETIVVAVGNLIGIALNNAYRERQSLLEFLFGSSVGSKTKDKQ